MWIEFEEGDLSYPVWTGTWYQSGQIPESATPKQKVLKTTSGHKIVLDDDASSITVTDANGNAVSMDGSAIKITAGQAGSSTFQASVSLDDGLRNAFRDLPSIAFDQTGMMYVAWVEALAYAKKAGLDVQTVIDTISKGAAQSWQMENRYKTMNDGKFDFGFAVEWMRKDLSICLSEARRNGANLPVTALVDQFYAEVEKMGGKRWDTSSLLARLQR